MTLSNNILETNFKNLIKCNLDFNIISKNLLEEELLPQELHIKIDKKSISILRRHEFQDNLRIEFFLNFLVQSLNLLNKELNCELIANLSEGIEDNYKIKRFAYSQKKSLNHILIPDAHNFVTFDKVNALSTIDIPFDQKNDCAIFVGSDTGFIKDGFTARSLFCSKYNNTDKTIAKLTGGVRDEVKQNLINFEKIYDNFWTIKDQLKNKVILNIDGNSTSWERPIWAMASNSICIYIEPFHEREFESWFYPMLEFFAVLPKVSISNYKFFIENSFDDEYWQNLNNNQQIFAKYVANLNVQKIYLANLLLNYNEQYNA